MPRYRAGMDGHQRHSKGGAGALGWGRVRERALQRRSLRLGHELHGCMSIERGSEVSDVWGPSNVHTLICIGGVLVIVLVL